MSPRLSRGLAHVSREGAIISASLAGDATIARRPIGPPLPGRCLSSAPAASNQLTSSRLEGVLTPEVVRARVSTWPHKARVVRARTRGHRQLGSTYPLPSAPPEEGWPSCCTARGMARWLTGGSVEFPGLASRAANRAHRGRLTVPMHIASHLAHTRRGPSIPGH